MAEERIDLREILRTLRKRIWIILIVTFLSTAASGIVSYYFMSPIYQASTQLLVNSKDSVTNTVTANDIRFSLEIIQTYIEVITSPRILEKAIAEMKLNTTADALKKKMNVSTVKESQIISLTITDIDQKRAAQLANGIASTFQKEIPLIMKVDNVQILAQAQPEEHPDPIKPKPLLNIAIAFAIGLMLSIGFIFLLEFLNNTIKNEQDVEKYLKLPVLGMVAPITGKEIAAVSAWTEKVARQAEAPQAEAPQAEAPQAEAPQAAAPQAAAPQAAVHQAEAPKGETHLEA